MTILPEGNITLKKRRPLNKIVAVILTLTFAIPLEVGDIAFAEVSALDPSDKPDSLKDDFQKLEKERYLDESLKKLNRMREASRTTNYEKIKQSNLDVNAVRAGVNINKIPRIFMHN